MFYNLLAASGLLFWAAVIGLFFLVSLPLKSDRPVGGIVLLVIGIAALVFVSDAARQINLFWLLVLLPVYFAIGVGWAFYSWRAYVLGQKEGMKKSFAEYLERELREGEARKSFAEYASLPTAAQNKERITGWIVLWPWSMSWIVLRFPYRFGAWIYERISTVFDRYAAKLWAE